MFRKTLQTTFIPFLFASFSFFACSGSKEQAKADDATADQGTSNSSKNDSTVQATVKDYRHLDGCLYMLITENGKKLNPLDLDTAYFEDGLKVKVRYRKKDAVTTCMSGQNIEVLDIEVLE